MPLHLRQNYYGMFDTKLLADDLAMLLHNATGLNFEVKQGRPFAGKGIFLEWDSTRRDLGNEEGIVESNGNGYLHITGKFTTGISYAMYSWLNEQGFRFFLPGDDWSRLPIIKKFAAIKFRKAYKPAFKVRMFTASGGSSIVKGVDESGANDYQWRLWYRRNRMGCDYIRIDGHAGEAFNIARRKEIEADTMILAPVNGRRQYTVSAKLDPTYKKAVSLFTAWAMEQFKNEQLAMPAFLPFKKYYTVDFADGLGYCETGECKKVFQTISDQGIFIANTAAKEFAKSDARAGVSILAYGPRAAVPNSEIEKNVHVLVVPGAFQTAGTNAGLIKSWSEKHPNFSVYDYLNIGVWSLDKPFFDMRQYHRYLNFLQRSGAAGISFETSQSKFGSGILQYFILKYLCTPYQSLDEELAEFADLNFGKASRPIKNLLQEWYFSSVHLQSNNNFPSFYEDELGRFLQYLTDADKLTTSDNLIKKKIVELKGYTVYLCKFYEWIVELESLRQYATDPGLKTSRAEKLLEFIWMFYKKMIFHNTDLNNLYKQYLKPEAKEKWNLHKSSAFEKILPATEAFVEREFRQMKTKFAPVGVTPEIVPDAVFQTLLKHGADSLLISTADESAFQNFIYPVEFYAGENSAITIELLTGESKAKAGESIAIINLESDDYEYLKTEKILFPAKSKIVSFKIPRTGFYKLYLSQLNSTSIFYKVYPKNGIFYLHKKALPASGLLFQAVSSKKLYPNHYAAVWVPNDDSLYFSRALYSASNTTKFFSSDGQEIKISASGRPDQFAVPIPTTSGPNVIYFSNSQFRWPIVLKNVAPYFFFLKMPGALLK